MKEKRLVMVGKWIKGKYTVQTETTKSDKYDFCHHCNKELYGWFEYCPNCEKKLTGTDHLKPVCLNYGNLINGSATR